MKLLFENFRKFVDEGGFSGNGPLAEPIEEIGGLRFDHEAPFGRERDPTGPSASVGRAFANYDFEKELIDLLFYDVKDAIEDGDSLEKIFDQVKADRDEPRMTHHRELDGIADKHIWKAITTIEKMDDED